MIRFFVVSGYLVFMAFVINDVLDIKRRSDSMRCIICYVRRKEDGTIVHLKGCPDFKKSKPTTKKK